MKKIITLLSDVIKTSSILEKPYNITKSMWLAQPFPDTDIIYSSHKLFPELVDVKQDRRILATIKLLGADSCTNAIMYQPLSMMTWHTNSNSAGYRLYITYSLGDSIFRYIKNNKIIDINEQPGWNINYFKIDSTDLLWHTIWTKHKRYAFGFKFTEEPHILVEGSTEYSIKVNKC